MLSQIKRFLPTLWRLGPLAVGWVVLYRFACQFGFYRLWMPIKKWTNEGLFFSPGKHSVVPFDTADMRQKILVRANRLRSPPDWFLDPSIKKRLSFAGHWSILNEFTDGDIKVVWEASRFEWAPLLAQAWRIIEGEDRYLDTLNAWLLDWAKCNPVNSGVNWKCGQEASIRIINLLLTARLLDTHKQPSLRLVDLIAIHCRRILPTIRYAVAQNNNHGTSEAAALFIGGAWLASHAGDASLRKKARRWCDIGRHWLEDRVAELVEEDGSFSQYSVNYHRVLIDTLCQVELWRQELEEAPFSDQYLSRCCAAINWLAEITDAETGDAPNIGANDGARLYDLSSALYRDFRPSVQLGSVLFRNFLVYDEGICDEPLMWLDIRGVKKSMVKSAGSTVFPDGGYVVLRCGEARGFVRFANFHFRPSHADCLHFDFWYKGENILRDGGTFSYNTDPKWLDYFSGTESHNTVQFDGRNQMPRLSRFLFGDWLKMTEVSELSKKNGVTCWSGAYRDRQGCHHRRAVETREKEWRIIDEIGGFTRKAVLRWRLKPGKWSLSGNVCEGSGVKIEICSDRPIRRVELVKGWESRHYLEKTELPVLEIEVGPEVTKIVSEIKI